MILAELLDFAIAAAPMLALAALLLVWLIVVAVLAIVQPIFFAP